MRLFLFMFLISLAICLPVVEDANRFSRTAVYVREVEVKDPRHRTTRQAGMSRQKKFNFDFNSQNVELDLELNSLIREDVNMYVTENNVTRLVEINKNNEEQYGYYQDSKTKASAMVKCNKVKCTPVGTFSVNGKRYRLESNTNLDESTHFVTEVRQNPEYANMEGDTKTIFEDGSTLVSGTSINDPPFTPDKSGDSKDNSRSRVRREIPAGVDIIELYIYTDEAIFNRFRNVYNDLNTALEMIRQYYSLICNEMDLEYQQVKDGNSEGIDIRVYFKGIHVALDSTGAPWSSNAEDSSGHVADLKALLEFSEWHSNIKYSNNFTYDHAMAMSGKPFVGKVVGIAYLGTVCSASDVHHASLIKDQGNLLILVAVHELGHFLSSDHDPRNGDCSQDYIMRCSTQIGDDTKARNLHTFSSCSINAFTNKLISLGVNRCTRQHSFTDQEYTAYRSEPIGGEQLSLDQQCQVYFGAGSYACSKGVNMCYRGIYCQTSTGCNGHLYLMLDHSPCQEPSNKWCFRGLCVEKPATPTTTQGHTTTTASIPTTTATTTARQLTTTASLPTTTLSTAARSPTTSASSATTKTTITERPTTTTVYPPTTRVRTTVSPQTTTASPSTTTVRAANSTARQTTTTANNTANPPNTTIRTPTITVRAATTTETNTVRSATTTSNPPTTSATTTSNPPTTSATTTSNPPTTSATTTSNPPTTSATTTSNPPTTSATTTSNPPTTSATATANPPTTSATATAKQATTTASPLIDTANNTVNPPNTTSSLPTTSANTTASPATTTESPLIDTATNTVNPSNTTASPPTTSATTTASREAATASPSTTTTSEPTATANNTAKPSTTTSTSTASPPTTTASPPATKTTTTAGPTAKPRTATASSPTSTGRPQTATANPTTTTARSTANQQRTTTKTTPKPATPI